MMKDAHVIIHGFVQGVGFRRWIRYEAKKLGLTGWVRNLPEKTVETIFQGPKEKIEKMITLCKKGHFLSEVRNVDVVWEESREKFEDFSIRHDF